MFNLGKLGFLVADAKSPTFFRGEICPVTVSPARSCIHKTENIFVETGKPPEKNHHIHILLIENHSMTSSPKHERSQCISPHAESSSGSTNHQRGTGPSTHAPSRGFNEQFRTLSVDATEAVPGRPLEKQLADVFF